MILAVPSWVGGRCMFRESRTSCIGATTVNRTVATTNRNPTRSGRGATGGRSSKRKTTKKRRAQDRRDIQALVLIALGLILGLGLYTGATGIIGRALADLTGAVVGRARYLVPLGMLLAGWQILRTRNKRRRPKRSLTERVAWGCVIAGVFSGLDLLGDPRPHWKSPVEDLSAAGGWAGVWIGGTLERYLGLWGEIIITVTLFAVAAVLLTSMSVGAIVDGVAERSAGLFDGIQGRMRTVREARQGRSTRSGESEPATSKRRRDEPVFGAGTPVDDPSLSEAQADTYIDLRGTGSDTAARATAATAARTTPE